MHKNERYKVESGHRMCHPETCNCWDWKVWDTKKKEYVFATDNKQEAIDQVVYLNSNASVQ